MSEFKIGDVVCIKSEQGKQAMTVTAVDDKFIDCMWYSPVLGQYQEKSFSKELISFCVNY